jgi:hypothetical protein
VKIIRECQYAQRHLSAQNAVPRARIDVKEQLNREQEEMSTEQTL